MRIVSSDTPRCAFPSRKGFNMSPRSLAILTLAVCLLGAGVWALPAAAQSVVVDGDLSDLALVAQGDGPDPCNEIFPLCKSGFDFTRILVYYEVETDTLYFGIDIMDVVEGGVCLGTPGPGVPGDADGDNDPCFDGDLPECEINEDQFCVGPDEQYLLKIDTNFNGLFGELEDLRVIYRGNTLRFENGGGQPLSNVTGDIVLGFAGAVGGCDCPNGNPDTEDIEIAIYNYSEYDPIPVCFIVDALAGSLVDLPPEDILTEPILISISEPGLDVTKRVRNVTQESEFNDVGVAALPGDVIEFEVEVCNTGNVALDPVMLTDVLPAEYTNPTTPSGACQFTGNTLECNLGRIDIGDCVTVTYQATLVDPIPTAKVIRNTAVASAVSPEEGGGDTICGGIPVEAEDSARVVIIGIACDKQVSVDGGVTYAPTGEAVPGQTVYFKVVVSNLSMVELDPVTLTDVLPPQYDTVEIVQGNCTAGSNTVECDLGPLAGETDATVIYRARLRDDANPDLDVLNTATVEATFQTVSVSTECSASVDVLAPAIDCVKEVSLDGQNYSDAVDAVDCQQVLFRVTISNVGEGDLHQVSLTDVLPPDYQGPVIVNGLACEVTGNTVFCEDLGTIPEGGAPIVVRYRAQFRRTDPGVVTNTANVSAVPRSGPNGAPGDAVATNCSAEVNTLVAQIECVKNVSIADGGYRDVTDAVPGQTIFFRVKIQNTGTAPFFDVTLNDVLPADCYENVQVVTAGCTAVDNAIGCDFGTLDPGNEITVKYTARLKDMPADACPNLATVTGTPGTVANPGCAAESSCDAAVNPLTVDLVCDKNVSTDGVNFFDSVAAEPGDTVFFEVLVSVPAGGEACFFETSLTDVVPAEFKDVAILEGTSCTVTGNTVSCPDLGPLCPTDEPIRVLFQATLRDDITPLPEEIVNEAIVAGTPGVEQNPGNPIQVSCPASVLPLEIDIMCEKSAEPLAVVDGQTVTFTVTITNISESDVPFDTVSFTDTLSAGFKDIVIVQAPGGGCNVDQGTRTITCDDLGSLPKDQSHTVVYTAVVDNPPGPFLSNDASAEGRALNGSVVKTTSCPVQIPVLEPCLLCLKDASIDGTNFGTSVDVLPGQRVFFRVRAQNCATDPVPLGVTLRDTLPAVLTDVRVEQGNCSVTGNVIDCDLGDIDPGAEKFVIVSGVVPDDQPPGTFVNQATVTGTPFEGGNEGKEITSDCSVPFDVLNVDFTCTKQVSLNGTTYADTVEAVPGQKVWFRVKVDNIGDVQVRITLSDLLPSVFEGLATAEPVCNTAGNAIECEFDLAAGASRTVVYTADVRTDATAGTYVNRVDLTGDPGGPPTNPGTPITKEDECQAAVVVLEPEIICDKGVSTNGISYSPQLQTLPEDHIFFRVRIENTGQADLRNVHLSDVLPADCYENVVVVTPNCTLTGNAIECDLGDLPVGAEPIEVYYEADLKEVPAEFCPNTAIITADTGTSTNPGEPVDTECSALVLTIFLEIPTLTEIGFLVLVLLLGATILLYRRRS
jgi:uncharacterized repeat protein (TIGR01451 family)